MKKLTKKQKMIIGGVVIAACVVALVIGGDSIIHFMTNSPVDAIRRPTGL